MRLCRQHSEAETWIRAFISHIHIQYKKERQVNGDYWDVGEVGVSIWRVPPRHDGLISNGVGIRSLPAIDGKSCHTSLPTIAICMIVYVAPRTNEGIYPGSAIEVIRNIIMFTISLRNVCVGCSNYRGSR